LKVLHVTPVYLPAWQYGGTVRAIHAMTTALVTAGHEVEVITTSIGTENEGSGHLQDGVIDGVRVTYVPGTLRWGGAVAPRLAREVLERTRSNPVVHVSSGWQPAFRSMFFGLRRRRRPYVYSPHGCFSPEVFSKGRWKKAAYYRLYERDNLRGAAAVVATSEIEAVDLRRMDASLRVVVVPNICDPALWTTADGAAASWRRQQRIEERECLILQVGRPDPLKNTVFLEEVVRGLPRGRRYVLAVMGPGQSQFLGRTEMPDHVRVLHIEGESDPAGLRAAYSAAQVVAVPSKYECFGNVVVEAALCGTRVVTAPRVGAACLESLAGAVTVLPLEIAAWRQTLATEAEYGLGLAACDRGRLASAISPARVGEQLLAVYGSVWLREEAGRTAP
jgi:glycosyltransferase involved in cell wall biosynthesis